MRFAIIDSHGSIKQFNVSSTIPNLPEGLLAVECREDITFNHTYNIEEKEWIFIPAPPQPTPIQPLEIQQTEFNQLLMQQMLDIQIKIDILGMEAQFNVLV